MIWWALFLFLAGMILVLAEFIVPGGICGAMGVIILVLSGALAIQTYPDYVLTIVLVELAGVAVCVVLGLFLLARTGAGRALKLETRQNVEDGYVNMESDISLIGASGVVFSALRPAGSILVNGRRIDAVSDGTFIEKDARVRIVDVRGNRVVVEAMNAGAGSGGS